MQRSIREPGFAEQAGQLSEGELLAIGAGEHGQGEDRRRQRAVPGVRQQHLPSRDAAPGRQHFDATPGEVETTGPVPVFVLGRRPNSIPDSTNGSSQLPTGTVGWPALGRVDPKLIRAHLQTVAPTLHDLRRVPKRRDVILPP